MSNINVVSLSKYYKSFCALDSADLEVASGEFVTLLGPSGSGKSTLLMSLAGFVRPSSGDVRVGGASIINQPPERRDFGVVFQGYALFPHLTVAQNLAFPLHARRMGAAEVETKVRQTLELVKLEHLADRQPKQLSGGQQQRVALARALVFSPKVMLLDEPMGALDRALRHDLQIELRTLHHQTGRTFINVTHDQEEAMSMSDRIAVMNHGRIVQIGKPRALYEAPRTRFVAGFLGKSNFLEGKVIAVEDGVARVATPNGEVRHTLREGDAPTPGGTAILALRPEKIALTPLANSLPVRVEAATFLGTHAEVIVVCRNGDALNCYIDVEHAQELPAEGSEIEVGWEARSTVLVEPD